MCLGIVSVEAWWLQGGICKAFHFLDYGVYCLLFPFHSLSVTKYLLKFSYGVHGSASQFQWLCL